MKYTFETDDSNEALILMNAHKVLDAVQTIYDTSRNQLKHGEATGNGAVLETIRQVAFEAVQINL